jgi:NAD-dependent DNA ligase
MEIEQLCNEYLEHSYRYYIQDMPIIPDSVYDDICYRIFKVIDDVPEEYKHIIDIDAMNATTGFHIRMNDYPDWVKEKCYE